MPYLHKVELLLSSVKAQLAFYSWSSSPLRPKCGAYTRPLPLSVIKSLCCLYIGLTYGMPDLFLSTFCILLLLWVVPFLLQLHHRIPLVTAPLTRFNFHKFKAHARIRTHLCMTLALSQPGTLSFHTDIDMNMNYVPF